MYANERGSAMLELLWWSVAIAWLIHMMIMFVVKPVLVHDHRWMSRISETHTLVGHTVCLETLKSDVNHNTTFVQEAVCQGF